MRLSAFNTAVSLDTSATMPSSAGSGSRWSSSISSPSLERACITAVGAPRRVANGARGVAVLATGRCRRRRWTRHQMPDGQRGMGDNGHGEAGAQEEKAAEETESESGSKRGQCCCWLFSKKSAHQTHHALLVLKL